MSRRRAVVIGGSIAGLCAGRVLSDFFDQVIVIDRDIYPTGTQERAGVPQSRHVHALLARGRQEIERLFPGFDRLMLERGANEIDFGMDFATLRPNGWARRQSDGIQLLFASRNLLESIVRELFRKLPNVELRERTTVTGIVTSQNGTLCVTGVHLSPLEGGIPTTLEADLIVDASGRTSKAPDWFRILSLEPPEETVVNSFSGYSSRWFAAPAPTRWPRDWWWKGIWVDIKEPDHMTAAVLFPVEQNRWIVTLAGVAKHYPPSDEEGFMQALTTLRTPIVAEAVRLAEPLSPVYCNRAMANRFRHYESWGARLDGFLALGDSACAFNPVYGQGMTTGTLSASLLADCLKKYGPADPELPRYFFRNQAHLQIEPWRLATGADFRFPETEGERPKGARLLDPYMRTLFALSSDDGVLHRRVGEVLNMLEPPSTLFELPIVSRVVMGSLLRWLKRGKTDSHPVPSMPPALMPLG